MDDASFLYTRAHIYGIFCCSVSVKRHIFQWNIPDKRNHVFAVNMQLVTIQLSSFQNIQLANYAACLLVLENVRMQL